VLLVGEVGAGEAKVADLEVAVGVQEHINAKLQGTAT
jgi:hypothetical protein